MKQAVGVKFIFVYGTLQKSARTRMSGVLARHCEYVGMASLQAQLYEVDGYTGAIESINPCDKVSGELHEIVDEHTLLPLLDEYEECSERFPQPHEYSRKRLPVTLMTGESITAWVYIYNHDVTLLQRVC